jgi:hypothetical protein
MMTDDSTHYDVFADADRCSQEESFCELLLHETLAIGADAFAHGEAAEPGPVD